MEHFQYPYNLAIIRIAYQIYCRDHKLHQDSATCDVQKQSLFSHYHIVFVVGMEFGVVYLHFTNDERPFSKLVPFGPYVARLRKLQEADN